MGQGADRRAFGIVEAAFGACENRGRGTVAGEGAGGILAPFLIREEQRALGGTIEAPTFYTRPANEITAALKRAEGIERDLGELYTRWDALDSRST